MRSGTSRLVPALDQGSTGSGTSPSQNPQGCSWPSISRLCERAGLLMSRASARPVFPAHPYPRTKAFVRGRSTPRGRRALGVAQTLLACGRATAAAESDCSTRALEEERRRRTLEVVKFRGYQHRKGVRWIPHRLIIERADYGKPVRGLRGECEPLSSDDEMVWLEACSTRTGGVHLFTCVFRVLLSERLPRYPESPESHGY